MGSLLPTYAFLHTCDAHRITYTGRLIVLMGIVSVRIMFFAPALPALAPQDGYRLDKLYAYSSVNCSVSVSYQTQVSSSGYA
jgi:hypothetical protein